MRLNNNVKENGLTYQIYFNTFETGFPKQKQTLLLGTRHLLQSAHERKKVDNVYYFFKTSMGF